jgi:hypothetical protein
MSAARAVFAFALLLPVAGCGYRSRYPEGRDHAVRSRLPKTFMETLEGAERLQLVALDEPAAFPAHMITSRRAGVRAAVDVTSQDDRARLIRTFYRAIRDADRSMLCFHPHHAIRGWHQGVPFEIVMCLSCRNLNVPDGAGGERMVSFEPGELSDVSTRFFEPQGLSFDWKIPYFGGWVQKK